jgi:IMP dehydrogenase/GMP reductase
MIDPVTALAGLQSAIGLVKKAAQVANDLGGLGVMVGRMFDAKSQASKAMVEAKRSGDKSNFALAMQIENTLMQTAKLEAELQLIYMQTGNIDVWNKIKARAAEMDRDDAIEARKAKEEEKRRKEKEQEELELAAGLTAGAFLLMMLVFGLYELFEFCAVNRCGR